MCKMFLVILNANPLLASIRRQLGVVTVRCQASCFLGRLDTLGPGGVAAGGWRQEAGGGSSQEPWRGGGKRKPGPTNEQQNRA